MTYSTHLIHLEPSDTAAIDRSNMHCVALTVSDAAGRTVARVELLGRSDQLDPVALAPAGQAVPA